MEQGGCGMSPRQYVFTEMEGMIREDMLLEENVALGHPASPELS